MAPKFDSTQSDRGIAVAAATALRRSSCSPGPSHCVDLVMMALITRIPLLITGISPTGTPARRETLPPIVLLACRMRASTRSVSSIVERRRVTGRYVAGRATSARTEPHMHAASTCSASGARGAAAALPMSAASN